MTEQKIYKSLTKGETCILKRTEIDKIDGRVWYIVDIVGDEGVVEERPILSTTFKRWWRKVDSNSTINQDVAEKTAQQNYDERFNNEPEIVTEEPTVEDLKKFNEAGGELTEEETQIFIQEANKQTVEEVKEKKEHKQREKKEHEEGAKQFFEELVTNKGCDIKLYTEEHKRAVKLNGKNVFYYGTYSNNDIILFFRHDVDFTGVEETPDIQDAPARHKPYKYFVKTNGFNDTVKEVLTRIVEQSV